VIDDGIEKIQDMVPAWATSSITTIADQQDYKVDDTVIDVLFCDWNGTARMSYLFGADFAILDVQTYDVETEKYKQIIDALIQESVEMSYHYEFREADRKLFLMPPPSAAGTKVYYIGSIAWDITKMPVRFEKYLVWYGTAEVLSISARKKRRLSAVSHDGGLMSWSQADPQLADAKALMERFDEAMSLEARRALF
jgi:hypothetical protein